MFLAFIIIGTSVMSSLIIPRLTALFWLLYIMISVLPFPNLVQDCTFSDNGYGCTYKVDNGR